jgi:hypothetical protein
VLVLSIEEKRPEYPAYAIEILRRTQEGSLRLRWRGGITRTLELDEYDGDFVIMVPRSFLPRGRYDVVAYGVRERRAVPLETYYVSVGVEGPPCTSGAS